ncbi:MAG: PQQ-binding-like beta-propeller repeat protein, partial [Pseudomonadales bacterium]
MNRSIDFSKPRPANRVGDGDRAGPLPRLILRAFLLVGLSVALPLSASDVEWPRHGLNAGETRFSSLKQINESTIGTLGLAWSFPMGTRRGLEASPIMVDRTLYVSSAWSKVYALDAVTGALKWSFDPQVPKAWGANACCDVVNRGVAVAGDTVFVGTLDGYLVALDRETGVSKWRVLT